MSKLRKPEVDEYPAPPVQSPPARRHPVSEPATVLETPHRQDSAGKSFRFDISAFGPTPGCAFDLLIFQQITGLPPLARRLLLKATYDDDAEGSRNPGCPVPHNPLSIDHLNSTLSCPLFPLNPTGFLEPSPIGKALPRGQHRPSLLPSLLPSVFETGYTSMRWH